MKKKLSVTIDEELLREFKKLAKKESINMSLFLQHTIEDFVVLRGGIEYAKSSWYTEANR